MTLGGNPGYSDSAVDRLGATVEAELGGAFRRVTTKPGGASILTLRDDDGELPNTWKPVVAPAM